MRTINFHRMQGSKLIVIIVLLAYAIILQVVCYIMLPFILLSQQRQVSSTILTIQTETMPGRQQVLD